MQGKKTNPFNECPVYETEHFLFNLVDENDAEDLLACYTDDVTLGHANTDNCSGDFRCATPDAVRGMIRAWREEFERRTFVRWSVKCRETGKAVGTAEIAPLPWGRWFFGKEAPAGILRLDLLSGYELEANFTEIIGLMASRLAADFETGQVIMKASPDERAKARALAVNRFQPYTDSAFRFDHYYTRSVR